MSLCLQSVPEILSLKRKIFHDLESVCSEDCLLVSNTSSLDINAIGAGLSRPERAAGAHFFRYIRNFYKLQCLIRTCQQMHLIVVQA